MATTDLQNARDSYCLVIDAACDLPDHYLRREFVRLLPFTVTLGEHQLRDERQSEQLPFFYSDYLRSPQAVNGTTAPLTAVQMRARLRDAMLEYDHLLAVLVTSTRSKNYALAKDALVFAAAEILKTRSAQGRMQPLQVECLDSLAAFAGYGVQLIDLIEQYEDGKNFAELRARQQFTQQLTYVYVASGDAEYILRRAARMGERSVGAFGFLAARYGNICPIVRGYLGQSTVVKRHRGKQKAKSALFALAVQAIEKNLLLSPHINFSYSGDLNVVSNMPGFADLMQLAVQRDVQVHLSPMSMTNSVIIGPDSLTLGMIAKVHEFAELSAA